MKKPGISADKLLDWPAPDGVAVEQSQQLSALIRGEIVARGGRIDFDRFMEMALYQPGLGYYSAGSRKFGSAGDFTTAPETSALFSICIARQCEQVFGLTGASNILELGAGSGIMAADILTELKRRDALPEHYLILERSADLRQRQRQLLQQRHADIFNRLDWLDALPEKPLQGIILANEVLDALPVHRLVVEKGIVYELQVGNGQDGFEWQQAEHPYGLSILPDDLIRELPDGYTSEYCAQLTPYIETLADTLDCGVILLSDYGYPRREYYHPQRVDGTLACYYRHRRHDDPFIHVGIQDITASVDFTRVAESAHTGGLQVCGFSSQAAFLVACGLENIIAELAADDDDQRLRYAQQAGRLLLPGEMGETFKLMALGRKVEQSLLGFGFGTQLHRL